MDVIVVEDSVAQALLLERQIASLGHTVRGARTGGKAGVGRWQSLKRNVPEE